jgi:toxin ParE1/3/4
MSVPLAFRREVSDDLDEAYLWYEARRPGLGEEYLTAVRKGLDRISAHPEMHAVIARDVRRSLIRRVSTAVYYRVEADRVLILAVVHGRRDPERWQSRA